jgi:hypothetical protein
VQTWSCGFPGRAWVLVMEGNEREGKMGGVEFMAGMAFPSFSSSLGF